MKVKYNESENAIEIEDGLKKNYLVLKALMIINLANALVRLIGHNITEYGVLEYFWIVTGVLSFIVLYVLLFKRSTAKKIKVDEINRLKEKSFFGQRRFSLQLKNGKDRILGNFNSELELAAVHDSFAKAGIA